MTSPAKRPTLRAVRSPRKPSLSLVKQAIRLYRGEGIPRELTRRNALQWLKAMSVLGDKHTLHRSRPEVKWGRPGDPAVKQLRTPRRLGERA